MANTQKTAILRALINDAVVEILVKSKIENIVYSVGDDGTEVMLSTKLAEIIADLATKDTIADREAAITALKQELLGDTPVEAYNTFTELAEYIEEHQEAADALTAAVGDKADKATVEALQTALNTLTETVNGLGALAQKDIVSESDLDAALAEKVNAASEGNHSHSNKTVLDGITEQNVTDWNDAVSKEHEHDNKEELDKIESGDKAKWDAAAVDTAAIKADYLTSADKYDDTTLAGRVSAIEADYLKEEDKYDDTALAARVTAIEEDYLTSEDKYDDTALAARVKAVEDDYLTSEDKTELQGNIDTNAQAIAAVKEDVDAFFADADLTESAKDTLKELQEYIASDETAASEMLASIQQNAKDIEAVEGRMDTAEGKITTLEGQAHTHDNKDVIDGITAEKVSAWDAAEQNAKGYAKEYADGLAGNYDAKGAADQALTDAKAYADGLAGNYDASGAAAQALTDAKAYTDEKNSAMDTRVKAVEDKAHEHSNKDVLDGITAETVAAWNVKGRIIYSATQPSDLTEYDLWVQLLD